MVGKSEDVNPKLEIEPDQLPERVAALPGVAELRRAGGEAPVYLVGGAVRDVLLGSERADLDVVVEGEIGPLARALGGELTEHERFETASVLLGDLEIDIARARTESYGHPGALPQVSPATLAEDLRRRDFTVNSMAVAVSGEGGLIDPTGGLDDLRAGALRALHERSFSDDPTRALRGARYAARLGLALEPGTERQLRTADLGTVSQDRVTAELAQIAYEPAPSDALGLVAEWGLLDLGTGPRLAAAIERLVSARRPWAEFADQATAVLLAVAPGDHPARLRARAAKLAHHATPGSPAEVQVLAHDHVPEVLAMARAAGAAWLDDYVERLRHVELEIDGYDLMAEGVPEGAPVGIGLNAALAAKLDGGSTRTRRRAPDRAGGNSDEPSRIRAGPHDRVATRRPRTRSGRRRR